jgi:hypothetical protein
MAIKSKKSKLEEAPSLKELRKRSVASTNSFDALRRDLSNESKLTRQIKKSFRELTRYFEAVRKDRLDARLRKELAILLNAIDRSQRNIDQRLEDADRRSLILELEVASCSLDLLNDRLSSAAWK